MPISMQPISCSFGVIKASQGHSVVKKAAYNCREKIHSDKLNEDINYKFKQDLLFKNILAPDNAEPWVFNRQQHYNKVEAQDNRKNSQLGRTITIGLPHELTVEENRQLLERYLNNHFVNLGMVADYAIHAPEPGGDERNIHTHVILSMRRLDGNKFSSHKAREWNRIDVETWREAWATEVNRIYEAKGIDKRVTHLSLERQGSKKLPQRHMGKKSSNLRRHHGINTSRSKYNDLIKEYNSLIDEIAAEADAEDEATAASFDSIVERTSNLLEATEAIKTEELEYWVEIRELEGVEVEIEAAKIASQYDTLQQASLDLSDEVIKAHHKRRRKQKPDRDSNSQSIDLEQSKRSTTQPTSGSNSDAVQKTAELETVTTASTQSDPKPNTVKSDLAEVEPPLAIELSRTSQSDRPYRERAAIDIACRVAARKPTPQAVNNPTNVYRRQLAKEIKQSTPEAVANAYKNNDDTALEYERRIYRFMRSKGFNHQQIRRAMRQASPAVYKKSKLEADRYARRFNEWARKQQQLQQRNQQQKRRMRRRR